MMPVQPYQPNQPIQPVQLYQPNQPIQPYQPIPQNLDASQLVANYNYVVGQLSAEVKELKAGNFLFNSL